MVHHFIRKGPPPVVAYTLILLITLLLFVLAEFVVGLVQQRMAQVQRVEAVAEIAQRRADLESRINSVLYLSSTLNTYVRVNPNSNVDRWYELAREIVREAPLVRNIGLAPDNVMRFVYPLSGNEAALGLVYQERPDQWPSVVEAMLTEKMTLAGPVNLVQGGKGLIARTPIYYEEGGERHYWGLSSVVINYDDLISDVGLKNGNDAFRLAIRGRDAKGSEGEVFFGDPAVFDEPLARMPVYFPNGSWIIAAKTDNGRIPSLTWLRTAAWGLVLLFAAVAAVCYQLYRFALNQSLTDPLTGCENRRSLLQKTQLLADLYPRSGIGFSMLFIDLNHFKQVNDTYGHHVGDMLLIEAAARLGAHVRKSDTLARNGGDEFILLMPGTRCRDAKALAAKIESVMSEPFAMGDQEIFISASVGFAVFPDEAKSADQLINLADTRMYSRKREKKAEEASRAGESAEQEP
ncbi:sensor domain-containing diguanylate cyclase [Marinobacterium sp. AK62]|uniref:Sensor domain-containing diguanylate cyclase n=1 Tax=Marinobacterium alkalitolerans TaxID=1542925 RepID=A0ABS3ZAF6_9GAMM|nr:diguanylate cyclase [Marinobacterium alkalitolerans]MBP0048681.1 sensor domain-containing diguanylate cyclase [Marinobacterium alkalitolerans]